VDSASDGLIGSGTFVSALVGSTSSRIDGSFDTSTMLTSSSFSGSSIC